jgi:hypothetical protein
MQGMEERSQWEIVALQKGSLSMGNYAQIVNRQIDLKNISGQIGKDKFREGSVSEKTGYCTCFQEGCGMKRCRRRYLVGLSSSYLAPSVSQNLGNWPYRTSKSSCEPRKHVIGGQ